jgi:hypothetical protein
MTNEDYLASTVEFKKGYKQAIADTLELMREVNPTIERLQSSLNALILMVP